MRDGRKRRPKGDGKETLCNTRRYRHAVLYFIQMQLTSLHFFFLISTCSSPLPPLPPTCTPHAAGGNTGRVYNTTIMYIVLYCRYHI